MGLIGTHGAPRTAENPGGLGRDFWTYDSALNRLIWDFQQRPFSRFLIHQIGGWALHSHMGGSHWWTCPIHLREAVRDAIEVVAVHRPELTVEMYGGMRVSTPWSLEWTHALDMRDVDDRNLIGLQNAIPWALQGAARWWLDGGSKRSFRQQAIRVCNFLGHQGIRCGIEAFPTHISPDGRVTLDLATMARVPSMASLRFVHWGDPDRQWRVSYDDPRRRLYEAIVWAESIDYHPPAIEELAGLLKRGFVLAAFPALDALVVAAYDQADMEVMA